ncbi:MAG TPA: fibronectin type III domain-containing protein, partial [Thermoanaerobaculia bacterium]|nr:fibronectin type III domain-containing protein [Thermoanaerobaculia bacterium]
IITRYLPVTIDWVFSTGHDNPLWAVTYDVDQIAANGGQPVAADMYYDDSRAPYGELNIDGYGFNDLNGVAWGDFYKFTSTNAQGTGVTWDSPFNWTATNTVPYVKVWLDAPLTADNPARNDAAMGIVQTQTITQQDAGGARDLGIGSDITPYWHKTQADNVHSAGAHAIPDGDNWPYQTIGDNLYSGGTTNNARMTWKTQFGFIGQTSYRINNGAVESSLTTAPGYPKKSYSTYVVLGQQSALPVDAQVTQVETIQSLTLTTAGGAGSVVTAGPAGVTRADNVTYAPAGYNHVYGALAFSATNSNLDANIAVGSGTLKKPLIILSNYTTGADPLSVKFASTTLAADIDYFASVRTGANELWITLNRDLTGAANHLEITGAAGALSAPTNVLATATSASLVTISWSAVAGAATYEIQRSLNFGAANNGFTTLTTTASLSVNNSGLTANTTYLYKVRAINGATMSAFSTIDPATTTIFTDDPLNTGVAAKAVHVTQLRTAVNAMRAAANLGAQSFTDPSLASGVIIKALHQNELRTALNQARTAIGLSAIVYTDPPTVTGGATPIKAAHIVNLRDGVK